MGSFFAFFLCIHGNNPRAVLVWGKRFHTKTSLPVGIRYLPIGKRASVTTANKYLDLWRHLVTHCDVNAKYHECHFAAVWTCM